MATGTQMLPTFQITWMKRSSWCNDTPCSTPTILWHLSSVSHFLCPVFIGVVVIQCQGDLLLWQGLIFVSVIHTHGTFEPLSFPYTWSVSQLAAEYRWSTWKATYKRLKPLTHRQASAGKELSTPHLSHLGRLLRETGVRTHSIVSVSLYLLLITPSINWQLTQLLTFLFNSI